MIPTMNILVYVLYTGCTHAGIPAFISSKLYYEPLHTIEKYTLLQYTIFQLKIITFNFECSTRI